MNQRKPIFLSITRAIFQKFWCHLPYAAQHFCLSEELSMFLGPLLFGEPQILEYVNNPIFLKIDYIMGPTFFILLDLQY